jgi:hypothetical protein
MAFSSMTRARQVWSLQVSICERNSWIAVVVLDRTQILFEKAELSDLGRKLKQNIVANRSELSKHLEN